MPPPLPLLFKREVVLFHRQHSPRGEGICATIEDKNLLAALRCLSAPSGSGVELRLKWPFTEWETGLEQKSRKNGKENGKWFQARNGRKMANEMEKRPKISFWGPFFHFGCHFSAISGLGPFSIFFPIFPGFLRRAGFPFCTWPLRSQEWKKTGSNSKRV